MIPNIPALGIRFDIGKIESGNYGTECWKVLWRAVDIDKLRGAFLFEGDTAATLNGNENVYCIAVQTYNTAIVSDIRAALDRSAEFQKVAASPRFAEGSQLVREALPDAGQIDSAGNLIGNAGNSRAALGAVLKEKQSSLQEGKASTPVPERNKPASSRTANLPPISSLEELLDFLLTNFGEKNKWQFWVSPEELCDIAERYADILQVQWLEGSCGLSVDMTYVTFFSKGKAGANIALHGLFPFSTVSEANNFCHDKRDNLEYLFGQLEGLWGIQDKVAVNFSGRSHSNWVSDEDYEKEEDIDAFDLWPHIWRKSEVLGISLSSKPKMPTKPMPEEKPQPVNQKPKTTQPAAIPLPEPNDIPSHELPLLVDLSLLKLKVTQSEVVDSIATTGQQSAKYSPKEGYKMVVVHLRGTIPYRCRVTLRTDEFAAVFEQSVTNQKGEKEVVVDVRQSSAMAKDDDWNIPPQNGTSTSTYYYWQSDSSTIDLKAAFIIPAYITEFFVRYPAGATEAMREADQVETGMEQGREEHKMNMPGKTTSHELPILVDLAQFGLHMIRTEVVDWIESEGVDWTGSAGPQKTKLSPTSEHYMVVVHLRGTIPYPCRVTLRTDEFAAIYDKMTTNYQGKNEISSEVQKSSAMACGTSGEEDHWSITPEDGVLMLNRSYRQTELSNIVFKAAFSLPKDIATFSVRYPTGVSEAIVLPGKPGGGSSCFVATAAFSASSLEVAILRRYRDERLRSNLVGRQFIALYHKVSPPLARWIAGSSARRALARRLLMPIVRGAQKSMKWIADK
ncbi:MAG: CFI-box-CTERM domain-containing protein [Bacteroidota bacterium]